MTNNDYSRFSDLWMMMSSLNGNGAEPSENQIKAAFMFCSAYEFELVEKTFANMVENSISVTIGNILSCLTRNGMTKEQFKAHAQLTYRHISRYFNWYTDVVFTDRLAALAFHAVLKSHADYCESAKADDDRLCKAFVDFYTSYDVTSMPDYIDDLMIQYANYRADVQKVVLVGDRNACINVCNSTYGEGKWVEVSTAKKPSAVKELPKVEMTEDERKKNIDEAIAELKELI